MGVSAARCDHLLEGQLGDMLLKDGSTVIAICGPKCDRGGAGDATALSAVTEPARTLIPGAHSDD